MIRALLGAAAALLVLASAGAGAAADAGEIVYAAARSPTETGPRVDQVTDLFTIRSDGSGARRLTRTLDAEDTPSWSPRRERIAYSRGVAACHAGRCSGLLEADLWVLSAGEPPRRLTHGRAEGLVDISPAWSPDGRRIAFVRRACCDASDADGVYVVDVGGRGLLQRLDSLRAAAVDWGPGGAKLAVAPESGPPFVLDGTTGERRALPARGLPSTARVTDLAWSPDGGRVALATSAGLYVASSGRATRIGPRGPVTGVDWSRDGRKLAFTRGDLFVASADGRRLRRLTRGPGVDLAPGW